MKPLTADRLAQAMRISGESAALWVQHVNTALDMCGCTTVEHVAQWIAQVGHESSGLTRMVESLNYTAEGLCSTWPSRFTPARAALLGRTDSKPADQQAIAAIVYGDRLGNTHPGDGWRYRGRGPIQVTGLANYRECGAVIGVDIAAEPTLLETRKTGAASTAWYWRKHRLTQYNGDVLRVTRLINGGTNGLADRRARYDRALSVLQGDASGELVRL
jgi:putative chitinase